MKKNMFSLFAFLLLIATLHSCKKKEDEPVIEETDFNLGVLISNEGPFLTGTGTISSYNRTRGQVTNDVFQVQNGFPLGNIVQSVEVFQDKAYVVVNNAQKTVVVNLREFKQLTAIAGLGQPRFFKGISAAKGYITQWGDASQGQLKVIDLQTNSVTKTIDIGSGSDRMLMSGRFVYVCNAGGYNPLTYDPVNDSAISVIDTQGDSLYARIATGYNPGGIVEDMFGKLWVICYGITDYNNPGNDRNGSLVRIDPDLMTADAVFPLPVHEIGMRIAINETKYTLYYKVSGAVYRMDATDQSLPSAKFIDRDFYAMDFDPLDHFLYGSNAMDFNSTGYVIRYRTNGTVVDSFQAGIIPGCFYFLPE